MARLDDLRKIARVEFSEIVKSVNNLDYKIRIHLIDNSFADVHLSESLMG